LLPGDSPIGFRLPLDSLPWSPPAESHQLYPVDPWAARGPLPRYDYDSSRNGDGGSHRELTNGSGWYGGSYQSPAIIRRQFAEVSGSGGAEAATAIADRPQQAPTTRWARSRSVPTVIRTAICVEPRDGKLHVFMPPVESAEDYIELAMTI